MKRICIVTYYGNNYGGQLQAFATQQYLENMGYDAKLLKYHYTKKQLKISLVFKKIKAIFKIGLKKYLHARKIMHKNFRNEKIRNNKFEEFRKKYLTFTTYEFSNEIANKINEEFDFFVSGSDQIWNPTFYDSCNYVYYLGFVKEKRKKISYASSIGVNDLKKEYIADFKKYVENFSAVSTREIEGKKIVEKYTQIEAIHVIDPTALLNRQQWLSLVHNKFNNLGDYIFCYFFNDCEYIRDVKKYFENKFKFKIISFPFASREKESCDVKIFDADAFDFVEMISKAKIVLTDSFHATIFSINLNVPFYCFKRQSDKNKFNMNSRIYSVLQKFELNNRLLNEENYKTIEDYNCDYNKSNLILEEFRKNSKEYLKNALGEQ